MILGVVVQNNDPKKRGRVKVFIPHLSLNLYDKWDNLNDDKSFEFLSDPKIKDVIEEVKGQLPWANYAAPIMGENGNHYYDAASDKPSTKSDSKPAANYEKTPSTDAYDNAYTPTALNDAAKGLFSIPKVGSRVWVFFENGNPNRPVYFATAYSQSDWDSINTDGNYPDELENNPEGSDKTHRNKMVISQRGGVIEINNTETEESIKISQYNGSFKIWNNAETKEFVEGTERKLVQGSSFTSIVNDENKTIQKNQNIFIDVDKNITVGNNSVVTIGKDSVINIGKDSVINVEGTCDITSKGDMKLQAPNIYLRPS